MVARSPIAPAPPTVLVAGWEVSARRSEAALTLTDCSLLTKLLVRAPHDGATADSLGVPFGRAARDEHGLLVGAGPGEWMLVTEAGTATAATGHLGGRVDDDEHVAVIDLTHGRALIRLTGARSADVLAKVCGIDLHDAMSPDGTAFRSSVAKVVTDLVRDDVDGMRSYLLHCERSSGQFLFDAVLDAGVEFGIDVAGFAG
jgi:heterotetrameric sarcosine oxidase gamma subunit